MHRHLAFLLVSALIATPIGASGAQTVRSAHVAQPCEQIARPEQAERAMRMLASEDTTVRERLRGLGITPQRPSAPHGVLRLTPACARLRAELRKVIRDADTPADGLRTAQLSFLELGEYYGVIVTSGRTTGHALRQTGVAPLYLFDRRRMTFVARLAL